MEIDREGLGEFLRRRRAALTPEDVGLPPGQRRRVSGLRREEVAAICHMSTDYYSRLERQRGPQPSEQMIAAIGQGLRLAPAEQDHLFRLAGHTPPSRGGVSEYIPPGMLRVLDRLTDTPAEIVTELGETLRQTPLGVALTGDTASLRGPERSIGFRWFTDPATRARYAPDEHPFMGRLFSSGLREAATRGGPASRAAQYVVALTERSEEFRDVWARHEVGVRPRETKHFVHPEVGDIELTCQTLLEPTQGHSLLVYTATPGTVSHERLQLLGVIGAQTLG